MLGGWYALDDAGVVAEGNGKTIEDTERKFNATLEALFEIMSNHEAYEKTLVALADSSTTSLRRL